MGACSARLLSSLLGLYSAQASSDLNMKGLHECWPDATGAEFASWAACCSPHLGPAGDPRCWSSDDSLEYLRCCAHETQDTLEGVVRTEAAAYRSSSPRCPPALGSACSVARNRTERAHRTLATVRWHFRHTGVDAGRTGAPQIPAIPVLGWPVAYDPAGLTLRLLMSLDFPVERLVLIATGGAPHLRRLLAEARRLRSDLQIVHMPNNLGCAGGWNEVLHSVPEARWWLVASHDVAFPPGALARISAATEAALTREARGGPAAPGLRSFAIRGQPEYANTLPSFVLTRRAVAAVGLFDENLWPAYAEDHDFLRRLRLVGGSREGAGTVRDPSIEIIHGPDDWKAGTHYSGAEQFAWGEEGPTAAAAVSAGTDEEEAELEAAHARRFADQLRAANNYHLHFCQKFGPLGRPGNCSDMPYAEGGVGPFGVAGASWAEWVLDPSRRACIARGGKLCGFDVRVLHAS
eukprot:gnl/TRDRNA2_/TRDRNA2_200682_c0_seq1.p1 gnl/TRDRNA2_/TRDRNA2_200682_c0~~gnl/TRDRNA2_/TRDRNA2_200682_c0_seq1.p1  ORF type:complete len:464 (+),score=55.85 gnl/TRDRNA2_/TRDRNA2_200682_c0_seq1:49-1440(+)